VFTRGDKDLCVECKYVGNGNLNLGRFPVISEGVRAGSSGWINNVIDRMSSWFSQYGQDARAVSEAQESGNLMRAITTNANAAESAYELEMGETTVTGVGSNVVFIATEDMFLLEGGGPEEAK